MISRRSILQMIGIAPVIIASPALTEPTVEVVSAYNWSTRVTTVMAYEGMRLKFFRVPDYFLIGFGVTIEQAIIEKMKVFAPGTLARWRWQGTRPAYPGAEYWLGNSPGEKIIRC